MTNISVPYSTITTPAMYQLISVSTNITVSTDFILFSNLPYSSRVVYSTIGK